MRKVLCLPRALFRLQHSLLTGVAVGILLGLCISLLNERVQLQWDFLQTDISAAFFSGGLPPQLVKQQPLVGAQLFLRCAVILESGTGLRPDKEFSAIRDTWAGDCNETLFFTDSEKLQRKFIDELPSSMRILLIQQGRGTMRPREWPLVNNVLQWVAKADPGGHEKWTVLCDGRSYVHIANLRNLLGRVDSGVALIVGRRVQSSSGIFVRSLLSHLFPAHSSSQWPIASSLSSTESPLVLSQVALRILSAHCLSPAGIFGTALGAPRHAGRTIGGCALRTGIGLWDPVDEESRPLIVSENLRTAFSGLAGNRTSQRGGQQQAKCCSDRAVAFSALNHKDQRLLDYGVRQLKVFGGTGMH